MSTTYDKVLKIFQDEDDAPATGGDSGDESAAQDANAGGQSTFEQVLQIERERGDGGNAGNRSPATGGGCDTLAAADLMAILEDETETAARTIKPGAFKTNVAGRYAGLATVDACAAILKMESPQPGAKESAERKLTEISAGDYPASPEARERARTALANHIDAEERERPARTRAALALMDRVKASRWRDPVSGEVQAHPGLPQGGMIALR